MVPGFRSCKGTVGSTPPASKSDSKSNKLRIPEKGTPAPSYTCTPASSHVNTPAPNHASTFALAESTLTFKYSKVDLMRILKIFLEAKG